MIRTVSDNRHIKVHSELDLRLRKALNRILDDESFDDDFILEDVMHLPGYNRQFEDWIGDISGRFIGVLALCSTYTGEATPRLHTIVQAILEQQRPSGRIGTDQEDDHLDLKVAWGQGRLLLGLLEYNSVFPSDAVLDGARRLGIYYERSLIHWQQPQIRSEQLYTCYTQGIEGVVALYRATGEQRFLDTARRMADLVPHDIGGENVKVDTVMTGAIGRHSHGYLSSLLGIAALYDENQESALLDFVQQMCAQIEQSMMLIDGTPPEFFPWSGRDEGCSTADWLTLNLWLGRVTGKARYFEMAERVWRNALYGNQAANGGFCHHHLGPSGFTGEGNEAWWCCAYHGPRVYYTLMRHLVTFNDQSVQIQFIEPSDITLLTPMGNVRLFQRTRYPSQGELDITIESGPAEGIYLSVRVPSWAADNQVQYNGTAIQVNVRDGYLMLPHPIQPGDTVSLNFTYGLRLERGQNREGSFWYGPLLLVQEIAGGTVQGVVVPPADANGWIPLPPLPTEDHPHIVPHARFKLIGIGNANPDQLESLALNRPQVGWLRPLSEQITRPVISPTIIQSPVVVADTPLLQTELARTLRGRN